MGSAQIKESIETVLNLIGLTSDRHKLSKKLSGGMKRRLSIGISLMGDPKVYRFPFVFFCKCKLNCFRF